MATIHVKMGPKGSAKSKGAVGPPIQLTGSGPIGIVLDPVDSSGADVVPTPDMVGTLVDSATPPLTTVAQTTDTLHYTDTIPAGTPASTVFTLVGGLTGNFPASPLAASQQFTTPPSPPNLPADLVLKVTIGP